VSYFKETNKKDTFSLDYFNNGNLLYSKKFIEKAEATLTFKNPYL